ncbi:MAG: hypothetical protein II625_07250 [Bacilli bacterium]|nr:hypothetical protein [Bacilli bacterium]
MKPSKHLQSQFEMFKDLYSQRYKPETWEYIEEHFYDDIHSNEAPDILMQIYSELDIVPSAGNFYRKHLKLIKKLFPLDGNIVEVGAGRIPALANLIASEQLRIGKGTITIYDPLLVQMTPKYPNIEIHKEYFYNDTDISHADLVVGVMPCDATESILENAIASDKDFYVAMCGCVHSPLQSMSMFGFGTSPEIYQAEVIDKAKTLLKQYGDHSRLEVTKLKDHPINYPILYNRR